MWNSGTYLINNQILWNKSGTCSTCSTLFHLFHFVPLLFHIFFFICKPVTTLFHCSTFFLILAKFLIM